MLLPTPVVRRRGKTVVSNATRWDTFESMIGEDKLPESGGPAGICPWGGVAWEHDKLPEPSAVGFVPGRVLHGSTLHKGRF